MELIDYGINLCDAMIKRFPDGAISPNIHMFTYHHGVFLSGMEKMSRYANKEKYLDYIKSWVDDVTSDDGTIPDIGNDWCSLKSLDFRQPGILLFEIYKRCGEEKYKKIIEYLVESLKEYPVTEKGSFFHAEYCPDEVWVDGLYMASPIMAMYADMTGKTEFYDMAVTQIVTMYDTLKDEKGLLRHGYDCTKKAPWADPVTGLSENVWGRAMGWFVMAVAEIIEYLPKEHPDYSKIVAIEKELVETTVRYQHESGRWFQIVDRVDDAENWLENSASCLVLAAIAKCIRMGIVDEKYKDILKKGIDGVLSTVRVTGDDVIVPEICVGTCIDSGTREHYISRERIENDMHGTGAFLMMIAEAVSVLG